MKRLIMSAAALIVVLAVFVGIVAVLLYRGRLHFNNPDRDKYPVRGVDVSSYQGEIDWKTLASEDIDFAYIKATEGSSHVDAYFERNSENAVKTDLKIGAYHFFSFESDGKAQAENFCHNVKADKQWMPSVVDVEYYGKYKDKTKIDVVLVQKELEEYLHRIKAAYGKKPVIYATEESYEDIIKGKFDQYPLWIRNVYSRVPKDIEWTFWQFSNRHVLSGYQGSEKYIDVNVFRGDEKAFEKFVEDKSENHHPPEVSEKKKTYLNAEGKTLEKRIHVPEGYIRTKEKKGSLGTFLRTYKVKKDGSPVLLYDGTEKGNQNAHVAVFKLPIENEDLQQCADSVMRVYGEYYYSKGKYKKIKYSLGGGFIADFSKWSQGYGISVSGDTLTWISSPSHDTGYGSFKKFMRMVFAYSGTLNMEEDSQRIKPAEIQIGDIFIKGGSPGHVVMVVDLCEKADGKKAFLLAQGYMPAQEFHVIKNPLHEEDPWYYQEEIQYPFRTAEYTFDKGALRRPDIAR